MCVIEENANILSFEIIYSKKRFRTSVAHKNLFNHSKYTQNGYKSYILVEMQKRDIDVAWWPFRNEFLSFSLFF